MVRRLISAVAAAVHGAAVLVCRPRLWRLAAALWACVSVVPRARPSAHTTGQHTGVRKGAADAVSQPRKAIPNTRKHANTRTHSRAHTRARTHARTQRFRQMYSSAGKTRPGESVLQVALGHPPLRGEDADDAEEHRQQARGPAKKMPPGTTPQRTHTASTTTLTMAMAMPTASAAAATTTMTTTRRRRQDDEGDGDGGDDHGEEDALECGVQAPPQRRCLPGPSVQACQPNEGARARKHSVSD